MMSSDDSTSESTMMIRKGVELAEGLEFIEKAIKKLIRNLEGYPDSKITMTDKMLLYTKVYNMCTQREPQNCSKELYDKYKEWIVEHLKSTVLPSLRDKGDEQILRELVEKWEFHKNLVQNMYCYFHYLDRYYTWTRSLPPLKVVGQMCFRVMVFKESEGTVKDAVTSMIARAREGMPFDGALLKKVLRIFFQVGIKSWFEMEMIKATADYYSDKASSYVLKYSYNEYMIKVEECLEREKSLVSHFVDAKTQAILLKVVQNEFWSVFANHYVEKEKPTFLALLGDGKMEELSRMLNPFTKKAIWCHMVDPLANIFQHHVHTESIAIVSRANDSARNGQEFVQKAIDLHEKCLTYVNKCFHAHNRFRQAVAYAFKWLCNTAVGAKQPTELLASFFDDVLTRDSGNRLSNEAIEKTLEKAVKLLPYICARNHFMELYRENLTRRLLFGNTNEQLERNILAKMTWQLGDWFSHSMEQMVDDIISAKTTQVSFRDYIDRNTSLRPGIDLAVTVLDTRLWLNFKHEDLNIPPEMAKCMTVFREYYQRKTRNRKLIWIHSSGTCNVVGRFKPKMMELIVTPVQAAVLLLFNSANRLSYSEITARLNMTEDSVVELLRSLSGSAHKILKKKPAMESISRTDYFEFNSMFTDKIARVKIPPPLVIEKKEAIKVVHMDLRYAMDAAIVRILKSRKVLAYRVLVEECVKQLGCMVKPNNIKMIKQRIEALMERDFLERDSNDRKYLRYLA